MFKNLRTRNPVLVLPYNQSEELSRIYARQPSKPLAKLLEHKQPAKKPSHPQNSSADWNQVLDSCSTAETPQIVMKKAAAISRPKPRPVIKQSANKKKDFLIKKTCKPPEQPEMPPKFALKRSLDSIALQAKPPADRVSDSQPLRVPAEKKPLSRSRAVRRPPTDSSHATSQSKEHPQKPKPPTRSSFVRPQSSASRPTTTAAHTRPKQASPFKIDWFMNSNADLQLKVEEAVGQGGFGEVFRGFDLQMGQEVALKYFDKRAIKDSESRKLFQSEVDLLSRMEHPNIIRIHRLAQNESKLYLVMDYWGKSNLLEHVRQKHMSAEETRSVMRGIVDAVRYLHSRQVFHRDIKAENVMLARKQGLLVPCLIDFGLAATVEPGDYRGEVCGTAGYMSPEMLEREPYLCGPNDVWQVGVLFYFMLTKSFPFGGSLRSLSGRRRPGAAGLDKVFAVQHALHGRVAAVHLQTDLRAEPQRPRHDPRGSFR